MFITYQPSKGKNDDYENKNSHPSSVTNFRALQDPQTRAHTGKTQQCVKKKKLENQKRHHLSRMRLAKVVESHRLKKFQFFCGTCWKNPLTPVAELFLTRIGFQKIFKDAIRFQNGTQTPTAYWRLC